MLCFAVPGFNNFIFDYSIAIPAVILKKERFSSEKYIFIVVLMHFHIFIDRFDRHKNDFLSIIYGFIHCIFRDHYSFL